VCDVGMCLGAWVPGCLGAWVAWWLGGWVGGVPLGAGILSSLTVAPPLCQVILLPLCVTPLTSCCMQAPAGGSWCPGPGIGWPTPQPRPYPHARTQPWTDAWGGTRVQPWCSVVLGTTPQPPCAAPVPRAGTPLCQGGVPSVPQGSLPDSPWCVVQAERSLWLLALPGSGSCLPVYRSPQCSCISTCVPGLHACLGCSPCRSSSTITMNTHTHTHTCCPGRLWAWASVSQPSPPWPLWLLR
jgi:hypothetical protein